MVIVTRRLRAVDRGVFGFHPRDHRVGHIGHGPRRRFGLQHHARGDEVVEALDRHRRDAHAAVVHQLQRALGHQLAQRLAHRHRAHPQFGGEAPDRQRLPRLDLAKQDAPPQLRQHLLVQGARVVRRHVRFGHRAM